MNNTYAFLDQKYPFTLPTMPYDYAALEPYIDARTMEIHHTKHHQAYIDNVNKALEQHPEFQQKTMGELLISLATLPTSIRTAVQNNAGGHKNHSMFWMLMTPEKQEPSSILAIELEKSFGSFKDFQDKFNTAAKSRFGSGWAWLSVDAEKKLIVTSTANQDSPISEGLTPILGLDVWEHAYYLKYQNKRVDYIDAWWHVINWQQVDEWFKNLTK